MIEVYKNTNQNYQRNGDITLEPLSCIFEMGLDGISQIELSHEYDSLGRWEYLINDNVIAAPTPYSDKQLFRIYNQVKGDDEVTAYARHIYFDNLSNILLDTRPTLKNGQEALDIIFSKTKFKGHSDITTVNTAYYVRKNIVAAIAGNDENSFFNRWGGEILYDNYDVYIMRQLGEDRGVRAEFGHNLKGIEENINTEEVITRIIPVAYNGYTLDGDTPWVDSPRIREYGEIREGVIEFSEIKLQTDCKQGEEGYANLTELRRALIKACNDEFAKGIDAPTVNYTVNMVELAGTKEYKDYKQLESVRIGDSVTCRHKKIGIEAKARCIRIVWSCLTKENEEVELGSFLQTYFDKTSSSIQQATASVEGASARVLEAKEAAQQAAKEAAEAAVAAGKAEEKAEGAAIVAVNKAEDSEELAAEAAKQVELAKKQVSEAAAQAEAAGQAAGEAAKEKGRAGEYAAQAAAKAKEALESSDIAAGHAKAAGEHEAAAVTQAREAAEAKTAADSAKEAAEAAQRGATESSQAAEVAREKAEEAQKKAEEAKTTIEEAGTVAQKAADAAEKERIAANHYYVMTKELYENASIQVGQSNEAWIGLAYINNCYLCE